LTEFPCARVRRRRRRYDRRPPARCVPGNPRPRRRPVRRRKSRQPPGGTDPRPAAPADARGEKSCSR